MGIIEKNLLPGEKVVLRAHLSSVPLISCAVWFVIGIVATFAGAIEPAFAFIGVAVAIVAFVGFFRVLITMLTTNIVVTTQRLIAKTGFISRSTVEILLTKLESIEVAQGLEGRLCNYGTLKIHGTGSSQVPFRYVAKPLDLRRACVRAAESAQHSPAQPPTQLTPIPSGQPMPLFEVKIADGTAGSERWIEVRASNAPHARQIALSAGAEVIETRLKSIA